MIVKRIWKRDTMATREYTSIMNIWDSGSIRYERLLDGTEKSWKVIGREVSPTGFTETLLDIPAYNTPRDIVWKESVQINYLANGSFQIPGWSVITNSGANQGNHRSR